MTDDNGPQAALRFTREERDDLKGRLGRLRVECIAAIANMRRFGVLTGTCQRLEAALAKTEPDPE